VVGIAQQAGTEQETMKGAPICLREIHERAAVSIGCEAYPSVAFEATTLLEAVRQVIALSTRRTRQSPRCARGLTNTSIFSSPGFGPSGAIGDLRRFQNNRQVFKTAGLALSGDRSGKRNNRTPIDKRRSRWIHRRAKPRNGREPMSAKSREPGQEIGEVALRGRVLLLLAER
jgi:hypothetical protein